MRPINVLHLRDTHEIGGPGKTILETFRAIDRSRFSPQLAVFLTRHETGDSPFVSAARDAGMPVHYVRGYNQFDLRLVSRVVDLVKRGFYDGQRIHRAIPGFLVQWGDPRSRDVSRDADWGRGVEASSGNPIGASELRRKHRHTRGAVGVAHQGNPALADSQIYVTLADRPDLNNRYTVLGQVSAGDEVLSQLERGDLIRKMYVKQ